METAATLLEYGAISNAESKAGFTPLHLAAQQVKQLLYTIVYLFVFNLLINYIKVIKDIMNWDEISESHICTLKNT